MGKRGPQPKSSKIKALEGNRSNRKVIETEDEVDLSDGTLRVPNRLCRDGKSAWREVVAAFPDWYFTAADKHMLILYAQTVARITKLERAMLRSPMIIKRKNGSECLNPRIKAINDLVPLAAKLANELHLTRNRRRGLARGAGEAPPAQGPDHPEQEVLHGEILEPDGDEAEADVGDLMAPAIIEP